MVCRKGKRTRQCFSWKEVKLEKVNEFENLECNLKFNNSDINQIKMLEGKGKSIVGRICGIGERLFEEDWKRRMRLFDSLVEAVMTMERRFGGGRKERN